ncbi:BTAD domain-containing putative transcriptional regulator [Kitasatospora sp. NPDC052868]|uniref:AfsR/SARP family transcriptional regulator n=1 Tax=Kitasatospora sp. NPDC052868 TaxID=3364060 RepID=UPI0037CBF086
MRIDLLGAVTVRYDCSTAATPSAPKRRALLAALAVELDRVVPTDRLIELVWDGSPPATARAALQGHVTALRRLLDGGLVLATRGAGYVLTGDPDQVDALRFEDLCDRAGVLLPGCPDAAAAASADRPTGDDDPAVPLLRAALDLWRGPALADCGSALLRERAAPRLTDLRLRALDRLAEGLCRLDRGAELVAELVEAVPAHPSHQRLAARLIDCLDQAGRRAEARAWYDRVTAQLPTAPGPALRLAGERLAGGPTAVPATGAGAVAERATAGTATAVGTAAAATAALGPTVAAARRPSPAPSQLPRANRRFVGRSAELDRLDGAIATGREARPILVTGPAGVGKTSLVQHWAHRAAERFPDGRLYADLRGFDESGPREPAEVLAGFLTALGVAAHALPASLDGRSRRFRELLAGRRLLIVLDNARCYEQLAPLLPDPPPEAAAHDTCAAGGWAGPVTVITSRSRLRDLLVHEGATTLPLDPLSPADARELLARVVDPARVAAEPQAAAELAEQCDRLPLALRLAAARLAVRPDWALKDLVAELSAERAGLTAPARADLGSPGVGVALDLTCRTLTPAATRLFALLGLHPGAVIDPTAAAVLADVSPAAARGLLAQLDTVHLLEESAPGLFARRELVRLHSARLAAELPADQRLAALDRLIEHYLTATVACAGPHTAATPSAGTPPVITPPVITPPVITPPVITPPAGHSLPPTATPGQAADWFGREEPAVRGMVLRAEQHGRFAAAWRLAHRAGVLYAKARHRRAEWWTTAESGLRAARACADPAAVARLTTDLAVILVDRRDFRAAADHLDRALASADEVSDPVLRHHCRARTADGLVRAGRPDRAVPLMTDIVARARALADDRLLARALNDLASAQVVGGTLEPALSHADEAVRILAAHPDAAETVRATHTRAEALHALGRHGDALTTARLALALGRTQADPALEARSHALIATVLHALGRTAEAVAEERRAAEAAHR